MNTSSVLRAYMIQVLDTVFRPLWRSTLWTLFLECALEGTSLLAFCTGQLTIRLDRLTIHSFLIGTNRFYGRFGPVSPLFCFASYDTRRLFDTLLFLFGLDCLIIGIDPGGPLGGGNVMGCTLGLDPSVRSYGSYGSRLRITTTLHSALVSRAPYIRVPVTGSVC